MIRRSLLPVFLLFCSASAQAPFDFLSAVAITSTPSPEAGVLEPLDLVKRVSKACPAAMGDAGLVGKRKMVTRCEGADCWNDENDDASFSTSSEQPVGWNEKPGSRDASNEFATSFINDDQSAILPGDAGQNDATATTLFDDLNMNSLGASPNGDITMGTAGTNSAGNQPDTTFGAGYSTLANIPYNQDDGRPIDHTTCDFFDLDRQDDVYLVYFIEIAEHQGRLAHRNPQAIIVSDLLVPHDRRYDVAPDRRTKKLAYRKVDPFRFKSRAGITELSVYARRGLLMAKPGEPKEDALLWFEGIARAQPVGQGRNTNDKPHYTRTWVESVFAILQGSGSEYWVPAE